MGQRVVRVTVKALMEALIKQLGVDDESYPRQLMATGAKLAAVRALDYGLESSDSGIRQVIFTFEHPDWTGDKPGFVIHTGEGDQDQWVKE